MKKHLIRIGTVAFAFAALAMGAKGQVLDQVRIEIPYEFVAAGKTLPAGTYWLQRASTTNNRQLILSSPENKVSIYLVPITVETARKVKPTVSFEQVGGQHFLSKIETADDVFEIPVSKSEILLAAASSHQGSSSAGKSGTD